MEKRCPVCRSIIYNYDKSEYYNCPNCDAMLYIDEDGYIEVVDDAFNDEEDDDYDY